MTVKQLIDKLSEFPSEMRVVDINKENIVDARFGVWEHTNYPYNLPDETVVVIE